MNDALFKFYVENGRDSQGRRLNDILNESNDWWEHTHDFIQWLFPLVEPSHFNPYAPLLDDETIYEFQCNEKFRENYKEALYRFNSFLNDTNWCLEGNHNLLRISRVLQSTILLGFPITSSLWYQKYRSRVEKEIGPNAKCLKYWKQYGKNS